MFRFSFSSFALRGLLRLAARGDGVRGGYLGGARTA